jgi:hypothetical protein
MSAEDSPSCLLRLRLTLSSNWITLFIGVFVFAFSLFGKFLLLPFRGQGQQQPWQVMATIDQADIRGSEPHNHDPSGAASD